MIKTLVSLNADLASDIAIRYACRLPQFADLNLQAIHVEEVEGHSPGTGWVRNTLERGLLYTAQEEISDLIRATRSSYHTLDTPIIRVGEREDELLREIKDGSYDLFMEGILNSFSPVNFYRRLQSGLYRQAPCPVLLVKNLAVPDRTAILFRDHTDLAPLVSTFSKIFTKPGQETDLIHFSFPDPGRKGFKENVTDAEPSSRKNAYRLLEDAKAMLLEDSRYPNESWIIQNTPEKLSEFLADYGLVVIQMPRNTFQKSRAMELLSHVPTATLLCRR